MRHCVALLLVRTASALVLPNIGDKLVTHALTAASCRAWVEEHCAAPCVLGFDTESRPSFKVGQLNPPAVVQLSTRDACLVAPIHVAASRSVGKGRDKRREIVPPGAREAADEVRHVLAAVLASDTVLKAGVGVDDDAIDLWQSWGLEVNGRVELGGGGGGGRSLAKLTANATGIELVKTASVQRSDWAAPLTSKQIAYAAADAWAGKAVYDRLAELDDETFGYAAVCRLLSTEASCAELYVTRRARQAARRAIAAVESELREIGLPNYRGKEEDSRLIAKPALRKLSVARSLVSKQLAPDTHTALPVGTVLEDAPRPWMVEEVVDRAPSRNSNTVQSYNSLYSGCTAAAGWPGADRECGELKRPPQGEKKPGPAHLQ